MVPDRAWTGRRLHLLTNAETGPSGPCRSGVASLALMRQATDHALRRMEGTADMDRQAMRHQLEDRDRRAEVDPFDGLPGCDGHPGDPAPGPDGFGFDAWSAPAAGAICADCEDDIDGGDTGAVYLGSLAWRCWECKAVAEDDHAERADWQDDEDDGTEARGHAMTHRERREARADLLRGWADKREDKADAAHEQASNLAGMIPFGQPILAGHHSQRRHERDLGRINRGMDAAGEHAAKAKAMRAKAENITAAAAGAVYSDDPDAVEQLTARLADLEAERARVKAYNATCRKGTPDPGLLDAAQVRELVACLQAWGESQCKGGAFPRLPPVEPFRPDRGDQEAHHIPHPVNLHLTTCRWWSKMASTATGRDSPESRDRDMADTTSGPDNYTDGATMLVDYTTGLPLRLATRSEHDRSVAAAQLDGGAGVIAVESMWDGVTFTVRSCYVSR